MHKENFVKAFNAFMGERFEEACISSTKAGWANRSYSVELLEDGSYRVQPTGDFGNLYQSPGIVLKVAQLTDDEWECNYFFDNAVEEMETAFSEALREKWEKHLSRWFARKLELIQHGGLTSSTAGYLPPEKKP